MLCWVPHAKSKGDGIITLCLGLPAWHMMHLESLWDFLVQCDGSQPKLRIRTEKYKELFGHEVADFIRVLLGTHQERLVPKISGS